MKFTKRPRAVRAAIAGAIALSTVVGVTACSQGGNPGSTSSGGSDTGTVTVWTWEVPGNGLKAAATAYEKDHPGLTIKVEDVGNPAIWDKITTGMAAGGSGLPDIMNIGIDYMGSYLENFPTSLANLNDLGASDIESSFPTGVWGAATRDGKSYGVPYEANTAGFYYRKDLFEKAGVDIDSIKTWDDLLAAGKKIKSATGASLLAEDEAATAGDSGNTWQLLTALQNSFYFNKSGDITMNNAAGVKALSFIKSVKDDGLMANVPGSWDNFLAQVKGKTDVAVIPTASWAAGTFETEGAAMKGKWAVSQPPPFEEGGLTAAVTGATYLSVSNTSSHKQAAFDFIKYALASKDGWKSVYKASGLFPAYEGIWTDSAFTEQKAYWGGTNPNEFFIAELKEKTPELNYTKDYAKALKAYTDAQTQVLLKGTAPQTALDNAAQRVAQQTGRKIASN